MSSNTNMETTTKARSSNSLAAVRSGHTYVGLRRMCGDIEQDVVRSSCDATAATTTKGRNCRTTFGSFLVMFGASFLGSFLFFGLFGGVGVGERLVDGVVNSVARRIMDQLVRFRWDYFVVSFMVSFICLLLAYTTFSKCQCLFLRCFPSLGGWLNSTEQHQQRDDEVYVKARVAALSKQTGFVLKDVNFEWDDEEEDEDGEEIEA
ncbi:hypothetical protein ACA910_013140 [Epithemia clementina (nom. ined.)]